MSTPAFPERQRQDQHQLATDQSEAVFHALVEQPAISGGFLIAEGEVADDVVHPFGEIEHVTHFAEAAIDDVAATGGKAAIQECRDDIADTAAGIERLAVKILFVEHDVYHPAGFRVEVMLAPLIAAAARIAFVACRHGAWPSATSCSTMPDGVRTRAKPRSVLRTTAVKSSMMKLWSVIAARPAKAAVGSDGHR